MHNPMDLTGRTILVTGASSGIGQETSILLSELGAKVVLVGRDNGRLQKTMLSLAGVGHALEVFDLTDLDNIPVWLKLLANNNGELNGLVHCAGIRTTLPIRAITWQSMEETLRTNIGAAVSLVRGFRQKGVRADDASIVLMASAAGIVGEPGITAYSASKGGLIAAMRSMAIELASENIRVNCVAPAVVDSEMTSRIKDTLPKEQFEVIVSSHPLGIGRPRDVANAVAFLLADTGRWITGSTLIVDGGYTAH